MNNLQDYLSYWQGIDAQEARLEAERDREAGLAYLRTRCPEPSPPPPPPAPEKPEPPTARARHATAAWRRRGARGLNARCLRCKRVTVPHKGRGLCASCLDTLSGRDRRRYPRRRDYFARWRGVHREELRAYWRVYDGKR